MSTNYVDIVRQMGKAEQSGMTIKKAVVTQEVMDELFEDNFTKKHEEELDAVAGEEWELPIQSGDGNYLVTETGERITL